MDRYYLSERRKFISVWTTKIMSSIGWLYLGMMVILTAGCNLQLSRYSDGDLTTYFQQPIPKLNAPLARTMSLEVVKYQTAANLKATMISDVTAREIYVLPKEIGKKVEEQLLLDEAFDEEATLEALNIIAKGRAKARSIHGGKLKNTSSAPASNDSYVTHHSELASEAYAKGDYLKGNIHNTAAMNSIRINSAFARAQATADVSFAVLGAMAAAGESIIKNEFNRTRTWIEKSSGAVSEEAPEDRHLSIFLFQFFDAQKFKLDSRNRVAVLLVLTGKDGIIDMVLEGSDVMVCSKECDQFGIKPTASLIDPKQYSADIKTNLFEQEGLNRLKANGFDWISGIYQYVLLHQGLKKLEGSIPN